MITDDPNYPYPPAPWVQTTNVPKMQANIYGWELYRVYRDEKKEIIKVELVKDNIVREFTFDGVKRLNDGQ